MQDISLGTEIHDVIFGDFRSRSNCMPDLYVDYNFCLWTWMLFAVGFCFLSPFGTAQLVGVFGARILRERDIRECAYLSERDRRRSVSRLVYDRHFWHVGDLIAFFID